MIDIYDYNEIGYNLQCFHEIFYKFWSIGEPVISKDVETCQVCFNKQGDYVQFKFNPDFWDSIDNYERAFFIAHECMHVILNHGKRAALNDHKQSKDAALDVVVNQMLTNNLFLFKTDKIKEHSIFIEDLQSRGIKAEAKRSFEYYYNLIKDADQQPDNDGEGGSGEGNSILEGLPINDHSYLGEDSSNVIEKAFNLQNDEVKPQDQEKAEDLSKQAGTGALDQIYNVFNTKTYKVPNFTFLFKKIVKDKRGKFDAESNKISWIKPNRRNILLQSDILLPNFVGEKPKDKIDMYFFQDISGSCVHLKDKFISLARKIPPKIFNIKYHTFDTSVREISINTTQIVGGGGTNFQCIEDYLIRETIKKGLKYPEVVVHLTDGESSGVFQTKFPKNHFWLLTHNYTNCIPQESFRLVLDGNY